MWKYSRVIIVILVHLFGDVVLLEALTDVIGATRAKWYPDGTSEICRSRSSTNQSSFFLLSLISNEDRCRKKALSKPKDAGALFKAVHIGELTNNLWAATLCVARFMIHFLRSRLQQYPIQRECNDRR